MKNYKMVLKYDGTRYNGWQKQGNTSNTIEETIEKMLKKLTETEIEVMGSGRTDAGAHAYAQVANFHMDWAKSTEELMTLCNTYLPEDIVILSMEKVAARFHSRLSAKSKIYEYRIWTNSIPPVFERKYVFSNGRKLDVSAMKEAASLLCGEHDFKNFCSNKKMKKSSVRNVYGIAIEEFEEEIKVSFHGNGFLYNMVRIMVGTLVEVGEGKRSTVDVVNIFEAENREAAGFTAPACGLALAKVIYE